MRGTRVKALKTAECPNPGRKHGGHLKDGVDRTGYEYGNDRSSRRYKSKYWEQLMAKRRKSPTMIVHHQPVRGDRG